MTDALDGDDILAETASRGEDGSLLPETKEITWKGEPKTVKVKPVTIGRINEIEQENEGDFDRLDIDALRAIIFNQYVEPDLEAAYAKSNKDWDDLKAPRVKELTEAFEDLEEKAEDDEGKNLKEMSKSERAAQMR